MVFIIGCGRSGTTYTTHLLNQLGLEMGHEEFKKDGETGWKALIRILNNPMLKSHTILHQVRHPIPTISSLRTHTRGLLNEVSYYFPTNSQLDSDEGKLHRCMEYWYHWNSLCEREAFWTYRVEELKNDFSIFCRLTGVSPDFKVLQQLKTDINSRKTKQFEKYQLEEVTWEKLSSIDFSLTEKIKKTAIRYGYGI